jgi:hypothetical protein
MESIIISVAVGVSCDFIAHYSHSYLHSDATLDRGARVTYMFAIMGISVLVGAITTFSAGFVMIFTQTLFFYQFGIFMMTTLAFSWVYSNFFFAPVLAIAGPTTTKGKKDAAQRPEADESAGAPSDINVQSDDPERDPLGVSFDGSFQLDSPSP